jgi:hypothetical protein
MNTMVVLVVTDAGDMGSRAHTCKSYTARIFLGRHNSARKKNQYTEVYSTEVSKISINIKHSALYFQGVSTNASLIIIWHHILRPIRSIPLDRNVLHIECRTIPRCHPQAPIDQVSSNVDVARSQLRGVGLREDVRYVPACAYRDVGSTRLPLPSELHVALAMRQLRE